MSKMMEELELTFKNGLDDLPRKPEREGSTRQAKVATFFQFLFALEDFSDDWSRLLT